MPSTYFLEMVTHGGTLFIPVPDIIHAQYNDGDDDREAYLVLHMKQVPPGMPTDSPLKLEFYGNDAYVGVTALRNIQLPSFTEPLRFSGSIPQSTDLAAQYGQALQRRRPLEPTDPNYCPSTPSGHHEWQDPAKNTVVACKACGKIQT